MSVFGLKKSEQNSPHSLAAAGNLGIQVIRASEGSPDLNELINEYAMPHSRLSREVRNYRTMNWENIYRGYKKAKMAYDNNIPTFFGMLWGTVVRDGETVDLGIISMRVVTDAGVAAIATGLNGNASAGNFNFHGLGIGTGAESAANTALGSELTTAYAVDSTRPAGTKSNPSANVFRTVATNTLDGSAAVTEHGIFTQAAIAGGTLLDRSVFSAINLSSGDSLETTYDLTLNSGG